MVQHVRQKEGLSPDLQVFVCLGLGPQCEGFVGLGHVQLLADDALARGKGIARILELEGHQINIITLMGIT